jgi:hypothetical protein
MTTFFGLNAKEVGELVYCPKNTKELLTVFILAEYPDNSHISHADERHEGSLEEQYAYFISNTALRLMNLAACPSRKPSPYPYDEHSMITTATICLIRPRKMRHSSNRGYSDCWKFLTSPW